MGKKLNNPKKRKKNKVIILLTVSIILILGGFAYFNWFVPEEQEEIIYQTGKIRQGDLILSLENSGVIQYADENEISSTVSGTIDQIFVEEETEVNIGDPILKVDDTNVQYQLEQANSDLKIAQLKLADLLQTPVDKIDQVSLDKLLTISAPIDGIVQYSLQEGISVNNNTGLITISDSKNIPFIVGLFASDINQIKIGQNVEIRLEEFTGDVSGTIEKISNNARSNGFTMLYDVWVNVDNPGMLKSGIKGTAEITTNSGTIVRDGQFSNSDEITVYTNSSGTIEEILVENGQYVTKGTSLVKIENSSLINQIATQKLQIDNIRLRIKQLEQEKEDLIVKTNYAGIINDLYVVQNQMISSNTKIAKVITNGLVAKVEIDELDIGKVQLGQETLLFIPAFLDDEISGTVSYMSDIGIVKDGITTYEVYISLPHNEQIKSGMTVDASILLKKAENALMVQSSSVIDVKGGKAVRVLNGDQIIVKKVEVGISNDTMTEILSGIETSDIIITSITIPTSESSNTSSNSLVPSSVTIPGISGGPGGGGGK